VRARACLVLAWLSLAGAACRERGNVYPAEVTENYMRACTSRASEKACRCSLAEIQRRYTLEQYQAIEGAIAAKNQVPKELVAVMEACR
jgi:hypothetical protein